MNNKREIVKGAYLGGGIWGTEEAAGWLWSSLPEVCVFWSGPGEKTCVPSCPVDGKGCRISSAPVLRPRLRFRQSIIQDNPKTLP